MSTTTDPARWLGVLLLGALLAAPGCDDECPCDDDDDSAAEVGDDHDGDGFTPAQGDCDDTDPAIHPGMEEGCGDGIDSDCDGVEDGGCVVEIPAGAALIGHTDEDPYKGTAYWDERPRHQVDLSAYRIDLYEVTNFQYRRCVSAGSCSAPATTTSRTRPDYHDNPIFGGYPVLNVSWHQAAEYCAWRGGRLPSAAEWEKGARGPAPNEQQMPWGDLEDEEDFYADCALANYGGLCEEDTTRVGSYPDGISPYGLFDVTGNAAEWVQDWYHCDWYHEPGASQADTTGPTSGNYKVLRGGMWSGGWYDGRVVRQRYARPEHTHDGVGFRCAHDPA